MKNNWISAKTQLPQKSGEYLVYTEDGEMFNVEFDEGVKEFGKRYEVYDFDTGAVCGREWFQTHGVTHWMPLPERPTDKGAEN